MVTLAAIVGDGPANGCGATPGDRYAELVARTGGELGSICDDDFAQTLSRLAENAVGLRRRFALAKAPKEGTLRVRVKYACNAPATQTAACEEVDRDPCKDASPEALELVCTPKQDAREGWSYESSTQTIFFAGDSVPNVPALIELQYVDPEELPL